MSMRTKAYSTIEDEELVDCEDAGDEEEATKDVVGLVDDDDARFISRKAKTGSKFKRKNSNNSNNNCPDETLPSDSIMNRHKNKGVKQWVHPPEALLRGHIVYNVKFLGNVEVDQPKGTEVVRDAIRKMKFNKQLKKAEGQKPPRVELTISVDGVTIQEPKVKFILHQYPLHRISYCADDKTDKKMLTFIAKEAETNKHHCFVFDSDKCAEEITLTIGQAFDLAYRKFLESSSKDMDMKKQYLLLQKKVQQLTDENLALKAKVADLERQLDAKAYQQKLTGSSTVEPVVGRRLENLILDEKPYTNGTHVPVSGTPKPATTHTETPLSPLAPPPPVPTRSNPGTPIAPKTEGEVDLFGCTPFTAVTPNQPAIPPRLEAPSNQTRSGHRTTSKDPFGMPSFTAPTAQELDQQIQNVDKELMDLQAGFSQGISFGTDDFSLADLDPLNQK